MGCPCRDKDKDKILEQAKARQEEPVKRTLHVFNHGL